MPAHLSATAIVTGADDIASFVTARCQTHESGHLAAIRIGDLTVQASGDGTRRLLDLLHEARNQLAAAHTDWLAGRAAEAVAATEVCPAGGVHDWRPSPANVAGLAGAETAECCIHCLGERTVRDDGTVVPVVSS